MAELLEATINDAASLGEPKKLRRITRACDYCHKRSVRCRFPGEEDPNRCKNCIDFDQPCLFDRVVKRRGAKPRSQTQSSTTGATASNEHDVNAESACTSPSTAHSTSTTEWKPPQVAAHAIIAELVEVYFEIIYPIFPFFHKPAFTQTIANGEYLRDRFTFAAAMAMCALVTARMTDHAVYNSRWDINELTGVGSEVFHAAAARECVNIGPIPQVDFDLLRACALLAITAIQHGNFKEFQFYLGKYHALVAVDGLHDERRWPPNIATVEIEERRRLFWSMYSLDIYSSVVWNGVIKCREQQSNVSYPTEMDDECLDGNRYSNEDNTISPFTTVDRLSVSQGTVYNQPLSWLRGWNFTIDLYRIMEHVVTDFRDKSRYKESFLNNIFGEQPPMPIDSVRESITAMYNSLPQSFKDVKPITCNENHDRFGFQAVNIAATMQLLRMVLLSNGGASIEDRCKVASEVVDTLKCIPVQYLQAISSPLFHQLAGIGSSLVTVYREPLSESDYFRVRQALLAMAQLVQELEHNTHHSACAKRLRDIVAQIDVEVVHQQQAIGSFPAGQGWVTEVADNSSRMPGCTCIHYPNEIQPPVMGGRPEHFGAGPQSTLFDPTNESFDDWPRNFDFTQFAEN